METREINIVEAAIRMILRYGMARTTMSDVAQEAGISRQTLYASFPSKEDLLRGSIRYLADRNVADIIADCAKTSDVAAQLDAVIHHTAVKSFELLHASPDADDIVSGFNNACKEELTEASARYQALIEDILRPYVGNIEASGMSLAQLADFIQKSTLTIKHEAKDMAHLQQLTQALRVMVLRVVV
ncbi:MAG: TetR family transcriptional regulator [Pseudomonadota bacterium]